MLGSELPLREAGAQHLWGGMWRGHTSDILEAVLIERSRAFARSIDSCRVEAKARPVAPTPLIHGDG